MIVPPALLEERGFFHLGWMLAYFMDKKKGIPASSQQGWWPRPPAWAAPARRRCHRPDQIELGVFYSRLPGAKRDSWFTLTLTRPLKGEGTLRGFLIRY
jgi:hypothetical protein